MHAIRKWHENIVEMLIHSGADVNDVNILEGNTILMEARDLVGKLMLNGIKL